MHGALCGVGLFLTASGTAFTGGLPVLILAPFDCSRNYVPLALRFLDKEWLCDAQQCNSEIGDETEKISLVDQETQSGAEKVIFVHGPVVSD